MHKKILFILILILNLNLYAQITLEKGYYIDNTNKKISCFIKNVDWRNNPTKFRYKISEDTDLSVKSIKTVKEFGINGVSKYIRAKVKIDRSSKNIDELSRERSPVFNEEEIFLRVLVQGKANLYEYLENNIKRYFYNKENTTINQLIFKKYRINAGKIATNYGFRQQLWNNLKCKSIRRDKIEKLDYTKNKLRALFVEYNECNNHNEFINYEEKQKRDLFNLTIRPRVNNSSLEVFNTENFNSLAIFDLKFNSLDTDLDTDFGNVYNFGFGIEVEYILPFNKNKWSLSIEPTYQNFKSEKRSSSNSTVEKDIIATANYSSIEIPISVRHYFFLNEKSKFFLNASLIIDLNLKSTIEFKRLGNSGFNGTLEIANTIPSIAIGSGYKFKDRYSLEVRYQPKREVLGNLASWRSNFKTLSLILGYSFF